MLIASKAKFITKDYSSTRAKNIGEKIHENKWYDTTERISIYELDNVNIVWKIVFNKERVEHLTT